MQIVAARVYFRPVFDEMQKRYGTVEKYFSDGLGTHAASEGALRHLHFAKR